MKNCFVQALKATVNDNSLRFLNQEWIRIFSTADSQQIRALKAKTETTCSIREFSGEATGLPIDSWKEITSSDTYFYVIGTTGQYMDCRIKDYFNLSSVPSVEWAGYDLRILEYNTTQTSLNLNCTPHHGRITGDISVLGRLTSMESLNIHFSGCYGSLESLAEAQVANGRTSGTLSVYANNCSGDNYKGVTVGGVKIMDGNAHVITFDSELPNGYSV